MDEDEVAELLAELERLLDESGLGFVVAQERALAAEGISVPATGADNAAVVERRAQRGQETGAMLAGRPDEQYVAAPQGRLWDDNPKQQVQRRSFKFKSMDAVVRPLTVRDRLATLLDLIEVATAGTVAMEQTVRDELVTLQSTARSGSLPIPIEWANAWDGTVVFDDPPEAELRNQTLPPWQLSTADVLAAMGERAREVVAILDALRSSAELPRGEWLAPHTNHQGEDVWSFTRDGDDERR